jgi:hypothetical protein
LFEAPSYHRMVAEKLCFCVAEIAEALHRLLVFKRWMPCLKTRHLTSKLVYLIHGLVSSLVNVLCTCYKFAYVTTVTSSLKHHQMATEYGRRGGTLCI